MKTLKILTFLCFVIGFTAGTAQAMDLVKKDKYPKSFKATISYFYFGDVSPNVDKFYGIGKATHAGKVTSEFNVNHGIFGYVYGGDDFLTAADGSELQVEMTVVHVSLTEANGTWVFHGGTGRFADVDGEGIYHVSIISDTEFILTLDGTIDY
jgi:hypothetical protein